MPKSDILIIGAGIGGLSTAIKLAENRPDLQIAVLEEVDAKETNAFYGQDGVATVWDYSRDSYAKHIADTLAAGDGLCNEEVVSMVVREGPQRVKELMDWGTRFEENQDRQYNLRREEGHCENRILHYKDQTAQEIQRALVEKAFSLQNIRIVENVLTLDFITQQHQGNPNLSGSNITCLGASVLDQHREQVETFRTRITVIATSGDGKKYQATTHSLITHGDGILVDLNGHSSIDQLYACGECAYTGFHGARRLASNSLLETLVFAHRIARSIVERIDDISFQED